VIAIVAEALALPLLARLAVAERRTMCASQQPQA
jgi:hypothetical protein